MTEEDLIVILDNICDLYKVDSTLFYTSNTQKASCIKDKFDFNALARKVFDHVPVEKFPYLYFSLMNHIKFYCDQRKSNVVGNNHIQSSLINLRELVLNLIVSYQLPWYQKIASDGTQDNSKKKVRSVQIAPRVQLDIEDCQKLIGEFLLIPVSNESKIWKQIRYILVPDNSDVKLKQLCLAITEAVNHGSASFAALAFFMHDPVISKFLDRPETILQALYLGPLKATTVEVFASGRSSEFRSRCREVLKEAEIAMVSSKSFEEHYPTNLRSNNPEKCYYDSFRYNTEALMRDLRGESYNDSLITHGWAYAAVNKYAKKTYIEKTWKEEHLYDLIWTIIVQRPHMKRYICELLEKNFHDYGAAKFWRRMQPALMNRVHIKNGNIVQIDPLAPSDNSLNFLPDVQEIVFVHCISELERILETLDTEIGRNGTVEVGLDSEWSAYVGSSKATILQLALNDRVFILDLESSSIPAENFKTFFDKLFLDPNILKLGFRFSEDLVQLRAAFNQCPALYRPENIICVGRLVSDLLEITEKRNDSHTILADVVPHMILYDDKANVVNGSNVVEKNIASGDKGLPPGMNQTNHSNESAVQRTLNRGLSHICELILGRSLDKTEQCSVWDRRPLRPLQLRYAAMDAYCLILLYNVCKNWSHRLGISINGVISRQDPIRVSPPLLSEDV